MKKAESSLMAGTTQLPGIVEIVPDAVETSDNGSFGSQEGVSHPYCKDRVLLTERLTGRHLSDLSGTGLGFG